MAKNVALVHPEEAFSIRGRVLVHHRERFSDDLTLAATSDALKSPGSLADIWELVSALESKITVIKIRTPGDHRSYVKIS
jgi:hypothetical protein